MRTASARVRGAEIVTNATVERILYEDLGAFVGLAPTRLRCAQEHVRGFLSFDFVVFVAVHAIYVSGRMYVNLIGCHFVDMDAGVRDTHVPAIRSTSGLFPSMPEFCRCCNA